MLRIILDFLNKLFSKNEQPKAIEVKKEEPVYMITKDEILMGRDKAYASEYTQEISDNIDKMLEPLNIVRQEYGKPMYVSSGWRPPAINESTSNSGKASNHLKGLAVDFKDHDGKLREWVIANLKRLAELGFYFEDFRWTPTWVHFQIVPPGSKRRVYIPSTKPAIKPDAWSGEYDRSLDY